MPKYEAKIKGYEHVHQAVSHTCSKGTKFITFGLAEVTSHPQSMVHDLQGFPVSLQHGQCLADLATK
jgi:hypothetical protein